MFGHFDNKKTIRLNDMQVEYIETFEGADFSSKLRRLINESILQEM